TLYLFRISRHRIDKGVANDRKIIAPVLGLLLQIRERLKHIQIDILLPQGFVGHHIVNERNELHFQTNSLLSDLLCSFGQLILGASLNTYTQHICIASGGTARCKYTHRSYEHPYIKAIQLHASYTL